MRDENEREKIQGARIRDLKVITRSAAMCYFVICI